MIAGNPVRSFPSARFHRECPNCGFLAWCSPANLDTHQSKRLNDLVTHQRSVKRGGYLHYAGSALGALYVVHSGTLKNSLIDEQGCSQVTGFFMSGELIGMDAIGGGKHVCDTVALEDSGVCGMPYTDFEQIGHTVPALQQHFHKKMSAEIARDHGIMFLLGSMSAQERVAAFLLDLSRRYSARAYSDTQFRLPMTRQDIGSYLGLKLETVSRAFSHFKELEIIAINNKNVEISSLARLRQQIGDHEARRTRPGARHWT